MSDELHGNGRPPYIGTLTPIYSALSSEPIGWIQAGDEVRAESVIWHKDLTPRPDLPNMKASEERTGATR